MHFTDMVVLRSDMVKSELLRNDKYMDTMVRRLDRLVYFTEITFKINNHNKMINFKYDPGSEYTVIGLKNKSIESVAEEIRTKGKLVCTHYSTITILLMKMLLLKQNRFVLLQ